MNRKYWFLGFMSCLLASCSRPSVEGSLNELGLEVWNYKEPGNHRDLIGICSRDGTIVVPPDVVEWKREQSCVYGRKTRVVKPAAWMSDNWEKSGWFLVGPGVQEVRFFSSKDRLLEELTKLAK